MLSDVKKWFMKDSQPEFTMVAGIGGTLILIAVGMLIMLLCYAPLFFGSIFLALFVIYFLGRWIRTYIIEDFEGD